MPKGKELACSCGYREGAASTTIKEKTEKAPEIAVVEKEESVNVVVEAECPQCGHKEAEHWEVQTRAADEPPTRFYKCKKCRHTWREYS